MVLWLALLLLVPWPVAAAGALPLRWEPAIAASGRIEDPAARVVLLSELFLDTPYLANSLGGGPEQKETLVVNLAGVDCFTLIDYVEALRRAATAADFPAALAGVRYRGDLSWASRKHFFTDWRDDPHIRDVTTEVGGATTRTETKVINRTAAGAPLLAGVPVVRRMVSHIPSAALREDVLERLRPGDYIGLYSETPGLDVSHVGILVIRDGVRFLRHASSRPEVARVVDVPLREYLRGTSGIVVLRPVAP